MIAVSEPAVFRQRAAAGLLLKLDGMTVPGGEGQARTSENRVFAEQCSLGTLMVLL